MNTILSEKDIQLWKKTVSEIKPIQGQKSLEPSAFPQRLKVRRPPQGELLTCLDLHGFTIEEAYQSVRRFIMLHVKQNSKKITVITGKGGLLSEGLIHKEIKGWLETPFFQEHISQFKWLNGGGALEIILKRKRKKC